MIFQKCVSDKQETIKIELIFLVIFCVNLFQMLAVLKNCPSSLSMGSLKESIDPNLLDLYPHDCAYKVSSLFIQLYFPFSSVNSEIF